MKWKNKTEIVSIFCVGAILGSLICFITLQFSYFEIKKELDVPTLLVNIITIIVGIYIANVIQKRINSSQNKYVFLIDKIDCLWSKFNDFSENIALNSNMDISSIRGLINTVIHPLGYIKSIYEAFELDLHQILELEDKLDSLETTLSNCPSNQNNIDFSDISQQVNRDVLLIQKYFSNILKELEVV